MTINNIDPNLNVARDQFNYTTRKNLYWSGNASMSEKIGDNALLQMEYSIGNQKNESDRRTYDLNDESESYSELNVPLSSTFESDYLSQNIGPSYQYRNKKIRLQLDGKYQFAALKSTTVYPESMEIIRDYSNFLPSAELEYRFSDSRHRLNLSLRVLLHFRRP